MMHHASRKLRWFALAVALASSLLVGWGLDWGLPDSQRSEQYLGPQWQAEAKKVTGKIAAMTRRINPPRRSAQLPKPTGPTIDLLADETSRARLIARFQLYSAHPREMFVFRAIYRAARPGSHFDPRFYIYGGSFLYPVALFLEIGHQAGMLHLSPKVGDYLQSPEKMGRLYIAGRILSVFFYFWSILTIYRLGSVIGTRLTGLLAAILLALCPLAVNSAHVLEPFSAACAFTLSGAYHAWAYVTRKRAWRLWLCVFWTAAAWATAPLAWPILLMPMVCAFFGRKLDSGRWAILGRIIFSLFGAAAVFFFANPLMVYHLAHRPGTVLKDLAIWYGQFDWGLSFSAAMVAVKGWGHGLGWLLYGAAITGGIAFLRRHGARSLVLLLPCVVSMGLMIAGGRGQPPDYARFFLPAMALMIVPAAWALILFIAAMKGRFSRIAAYSVAIIILLWTGMSGLSYHRAYVIDPQPRLTGVAPPAIGFLMEPAPWNTPAINLYRSRPYLLVGPPPNKEGVFLPALVIVPIEHVPHLHRAGWRKHFKRESVKSGLVVFSKKE